MFGGVTEGLGRVRRVASSRPTQGAAKTVRLEIEVPAALLKGLPHGGSVAVNGTCLSVTGRTGRRLSFDVISETLRRTTLGQLQPGDVVNLERPLRYGSRIEGHYVLGHVDAAGTIDRVRRSGRQASFRIAFPIRLKRFFIEKGSVAVDGVSLTIGKIEKGRFWIYCIPVTLQKTTFGTRQTGDRVNLEADWLLKTRRAKRSRK